MIVFVLRSMCTHLVFFRTICMVSASPAALGCHPGPTPVTEGGGGAGRGKGSGFCGVEGVERV